MRHNEKSPLRGFPWRSVALSFCIAFRSIYSHLHENTHYSNVALIFPTLSPRSTMDGFVETMTNPATISLGEAENWGRDGSTTSGFWTDAWGKYNNFFSYIPQKKIFVGFSQIEKVFPRSYTSDGKVLYPYDFLSKPMFWGPASLMILDFMLWGSFERYYCDLWITNILNCWVSQ